MEGLELRGNMLAGEGAGDQARCCISNSLEPSSLNGRKTMESAVKIVQLTSNKGMNHAVVSKKGMNQNHIQNEDQIVYTKLLRTGRVVVLVNAVHGAVATEEAVVATHTLDGIRL